MSKMDEFVNDIADRFIAALERGNVEGKWQRPWRAVAGAGMPHNVVTKKDYRGINVPILWLSGFTCMDWGTLKQWAKIGYVTPAAYWTKNGKVGDKPASERSTGIVFWKPIQKIETDSNGDEKKSSFMLMRTYFVLNGEQMVNAETGEPYVDATTTPDTTAEPIEKVHKAAHDALNGYCERESIPVTHNGDSAFYVPSRDSITLPPFEAFKSETGYLATFAHECGHSTGHESRLDRDFSGRFGNNAYAFEELIAEITSTLVNCKLGVTQSETIPENHVKYIKGWLEIMRGDSKAIINAAQAAQKAADRILIDETETD